MPVRRTRMLAVLASALAACWTAIVVAAQAGQLQLPGPSRTIDLLSFGVPALAAVLVLMWRGEVPSAARWAAGWTVIVAAAFYAATHFDSSLSKALAPLGLVVAGMLAARRPATVTVIALAVTGSFGVISIYTSAPYTKITDAILVGLWLALLWGVIFGDSRPGRGEALLPLLPIGIFLVVTVAQLVTAGNMHVAFTSFRVADLYLLAAVAIAFAGWSRETRGRIAHAVLYVALFVGAYSTLRHFTGPTADERAVQSLSLYNFVDGKLKLGGPFPTGADLGVWTGVMMPFCMAFVIAGRARIAALAAVAMGLCTIGLLGSQLRTSVAAVIVGIGVVVLLSLSARAYSGVRIGRVALTTVGVLAVALMGYSIVGGSPTHSLSAVFSLNSNDPSIALRQYKWDQAFRDLSGHPFGYGLGTAVTGYSATLAHGGAVLNVGIQSVDSGYLKIALEQGLAVMVLFIVGAFAMLGGLFRRSVRAATRVGAATAIGAAGALASFLVLLITGAFQDGLPALALWIVVGLGLAEPVWHRDTEADPAGVAAPAEG